MKNFFQKYSLLLFIFFTGIILRLWHINWGLPELYEEATPLRIAWQFWSWDKPGFDFNPHFFNYPALTFYFHFIGQAIHYVVGYLTGVYANLDAFGASITSVVITARLINVLFDAGIIIIIYFIAIEVTDKRVALITAVLVAINPSHIMHSHLVIVDNTLTFFCMLALLYIYRLYRDPAMKWYLLAGIFIALAAASKYTGVFLLLVLIAAHLLRYPSSQNAIQSLKERPFLISLGLTVLIFFALNPYIILDWGTFQKDFSFEQHHVSYGHLGVVASKSTLFYYLGETTPSALGWIFYIVIFATIVNFIQRKERKDLLLVIFPLIYVAIVSTWEMRAERYILPVFPILILIGSIGLIRFWDWFINYSKRKQITNILSSKVNQIPLIILTGIVIAYQLIATDVNYLQSIGLPDTRTITKNWIQKNVSPGSVIATGPYGVDLTDSTYWMFSIPFLAVESERVAPFYDTRWYEDYDYIMASSIDRDRYIQEPKRYAEFLPYYDSLRSRWKLAFDVKPSDFQNGPTLWIYRYPDSLRKSKFDASLFERLSNHPESSRISNFLKELNAVETHKGKFEKAEQLLREILTVEIENVLARNQYSQVLYNLGKYEATLQQLELSLKYDQNQPKVFALAGSALLRLNKPEVAEGVLNKAILMDAKLESPYLELIQLYTSQNHKLKLLDILKRYYAILPSGSDQAKEVRERIQQLRK
jgi:4-amino-4-deoxy-L-arabinose transferase-like glycosyltransferase